MRLLAGMCLRSFTCKRYGRYLVLVLIDDVSRTIGAEFLDRDVLVLK
jgi:hypothetical protein